MAIKGIPIEEAAKAPAPVIEYVTLTLRCPCCNTEFTSEIPSPGTASARDTDLRPRYPTVDPVPALIHSCPSCRYTAYQEGYQAHFLDEGDDELEGLTLPGDRPLARFAVPDEDELEQLRRWIRRGDLVTGISEAREPYGAERYLLGARCYDFIRDGEDSLGLADYFLRASWCARATRDRELEKRCQQSAIEKLQHALDQSQVPDGDKARVTYLLAEICRRSGEFPRAVDLFSQIDPLVDLDEDEGALFAYLAKRQLSLAVVQSDVNAVVSMGDVELESDE